MPGSSDGRPRPAWATPSRQLRPREVLAVPVRHQQVWMSGDVATSIRRAFWRRRVPGLLPRPVGKLAAAAKRTSSSRVVLTLVPRTRAPSRPPPRRARRVPDGLAGVGIEGGRRSAVGRQPAARQVAVSSQRDSSQPATFGGRNSIWPRVRDPGPSSWRPPGPPPQQPGQVDHRRLDHAGTLVEGRVDRIASTTADLVAPRTYRRAARRVAGAARRG